MNRANASKPAERHQRSSAYWRLLFVSCGWAVFGYWWIVVITRDRPALLMQLGTAVVEFVVVFAAITGVWIWHNKRIARMGRRGHASPFRIYEFQRDTLGRELALPATALLRTAPVIVITAAAGRKVYGVEPHFVPDGDYVLANVHDDESLLEGARGD